MPAISLYADRRRKKTSGLYPVKLSVAYDVPDGKGGRKTKRKYFHLLDMAPDRTRQVIKRGRVAERAKGTDADRLRHALRRATSILHDLQLNSGFSIERFAQRWEGKRGSGELLSYWFERRQEMEGAESTMNLYRAAWRSFSEVWGMDVLVKDITPDKFNEWREWMEKNEKSKNTIISYHRALSACLNAAVEEEYLTRNPISSVPIGATVETKKGRHLTGRDMELLMSATPRHKPTREALNLFLISYHAWGANPSDVLRWKGSQYDGQKLTFNRTKTGKVVHVPVTPPLRTLLSQMGNLSAKGETYILPYLRGAENEKEERNRINNVLQKIRRWVPKLAEELGVSRPEWCTASVLRQTVRMIGMEKGIPPAFLNQVMGTSSRTAEKHYETITPDMGRRAAEAMGRPGESSG